MRASERWGLPALIADLAWPIAAESCSGKQGDAQLQAEVCPVQKESLRTDSVPKALERSFSEMAKIVKKFSLRQTPTAWKITAQMVSVWQSYKQLKV